MSEKSPYPDYRSALAVRAETEGTYIFHSYKCHIDIEALIASQAGYQSGYFHNGYLNSSRFQSKDTGNFNEKSSEVIIKTGVKNERR